MIYLDSCLVIYLVEDHSQYKPVIAQALSQATSDTVCISPLVKLECLVLPLRRKNTALIARFVDYFKLNVLITMPESVFLSAARLRGQHNIKTPDALQLATARFNGCSAFWTNDDRLLPVAPDLVRNVFHPLP